MIAYYRDGRRDVATRTKVGRYLTRAFNLTDDVIRSAAAEYKPAELKFLKDAEMVHFVENIDDDAGLRSCMTGQFEHGHPYQVFASVYGWALAVLYSGDKPTARALVNDNEWVRIYGDSDAMQIALTNLGYERASGWEGKKLEKIAVSGYYLAPYLDGCAQCVRDAEGYFVISHRGVYCFTDTSGVTDDDNNEDYFRCPDCGDRTHYDDSHSVGVDGDYIICQSCADHNYTYAIWRIGRYEESALFPDCDVVRVENEYYYRETLADCNIVELHDGDYAKIDDTVYIESVEDYYLQDDNAIVYAEDTSQFELREDCKCCAVSGEWYRNHDTGRTFGEEWVSADNVRDYMREVLGQTELELA
jgi:hypothetical protein